MMEVMLNEAAVMASTQAGIQVHYITWMLELAVKKIIMCMNNDLISFIFVPTPFSIIVVQKI